MRNIYISKRCEALSEGNVGQQQTLTWSETDTSVVVQLDANSSVTVIITFFLFYSLCFFSSVFATPVQSQIFDGGYVVLFKFSRLVGGF